MSRRWNTRINWTFAKTWVSVQFKTSAIFEKKNSRAKAIDKITEKSKEENFDEIDAKQVQEKLTKLRNYYDAQRGKEENFKVSGSGTDSLYVSS